MAVSNQKLLKIKKYYSKCPAFVLALILGSPRSLSAIRQLLSVLLWISGHSNNINKADALRAIRLQDFLSDQGTDVLI